MSTWKVYGKKADFDRIGKKYNIDPVIARIIRNRGIIEEMDIDMYLSNGPESLKNLHNPRLLLNMDKAVLIIKEKISSNSKIRIIGDYDIDGICSIYILFKALEKIGADVDYVIPHRITDGYGINENLILQAKEEGIDTIITCDNGIAAIDQISYAKNLGMTVIVTDHHDIPYVEEDIERRYLSSEADAIINPKQIGCKYPFKVLCGAGVAFKLVQVLYEAYGIPESELSEMIEFAAIATIGDIVDLKDENRVIVKLGLNKIKNTKNLGLKALINLCGVDAGNISTYHIGFIIGPCLNASGRLDTAKRALEMLLEKDDKKAYQLAGDLKALNDERKEMTQKELLKGLDIVEKDGLNSDDILVVYIPECHESLAGIIAGRIREKYYKPTIVLTNSEDGVKGSGRSIESYNMFEEINKCKELLIKFGGHPMAAGMSLLEENVDNFRKKLNICARLTESDLTKVSWIDAAMPVDYVTMDLVKQLVVLEPFGKSNEKPIFADSNLIVKSSYLIGKNKDVLKITFENERGKIIEAISFHALVGNLPNKGEKKSILYYPNINVYNGITSLQFHIIEMR